MASIDVYKVGQTIDQYKVVAVMHTTPSSHLYKVHCKSVHKQQILKLQAINASSDAMHRFHDQANLLLEFSSHASIVDVLHVGGIEERPFMVMPYYPQTLSDLLAVHQQKLSFVTSLHIINQVLDALNTIHQLHIVHCDIKPQNIFLDEKNNALLADFDSALVLNQSPLAGRFTQHSQFCPQNNTLTPGYASPEQYQLQLSSGEGEAIIDTKSDMYSLGMLWYRMLTGTVSKEGDIVNDALNDVAPAWAITLIEALLSKDSRKRPSANQCKTSILAQVTSPEINHTIRSDALEISPKIELVCQEINEILLHKGWLEKSDIDTLLLHFRDKSIQLDRVGDKNSKDQEALKRLVDECQQGLIDEKGMSAWFAWTKHLQALLANSTRRLSSKQYQQLLHIGNSARPNEPHAAKRLLVHHFILPMFSARTMKRYVLPLLVIVSVFVYWLFASQVKQQFAQHNQVKGKALQSSTAVNSELAKTQNNPLSKDYSDLQSKNEPAPILQAQTSQKAFETDIIRSQSTNQLVYINWVALDSLPNIKIMSTEVTNDLFDMCAQEGACKKRQRFTTANRNTHSTQSNDNHPKVNVDWYEVTQQFIPWLNRKTQRRFALPTYKQWQAMYLSTLATTATPVGIHCKNCKHTLATQYFNGTMPVTAINPSRNGMYHLLGNVQEWLDDCWQQTSADNTLIQRCDQAMVAGGSWLSKHSDIIDQPVSQLLKSAVSPTTGFRLVEVVNE
jgi:serine/threonine protein kinase